jgi:hypothetical protein
MKGSGLLDPGCIYALLPAEFPRRPLLGDSVNKTPRLLARCKLLAVLRANRLAVMVSETLPSP